jgi:hypothetical protein
LTPPLQTEAPFFTSTQNSLNNIHTVVIAVETIVRASSAWGCSVPWETSGAFMSKHFRLMAVALAFIFSFSVMTTAADARGGRKHMQRYCKQVSGKWICHTQRFNG